MEENEVIYEKIKEIENKKEYTFDEQMAIECVKRLKNPFKMLTVETVMKDLNICRTIAYKLFQSDDFPSKKIGKNHQISLIAYLMWKVKRG